MAIEFNCPYCHEPHRLKNEYAGKRALCKNPGCRQVVVIPKPVDDKPAQSAAELEAAALSALADESVQETSVEQVIAMTCSFCEHKWTEPFSKAGKNILCPNPECRQRLKVPEPKADQPLDWRQTKTKLPSGAKQNFEKLEGVEDAAESKMVSGSSLREADATGVEIEPRTLKEKAVIAGTIVSVALVVGLGIWYLTKSRKEVLDDHLLADARTHFEEASKTLDPAQAAYGSALLNASTGEYALRRNAPDKLTEAHTYFVKARKDLDNQLPSAERHVLAAELALLAIGLGGSDEQVKDQVRFRWQPDLTGGNLKINKREQTVHDELRQVLGSLKPDQALLASTYDYRIDVARRLTRELAKKGQAQLAINNLPLTLFDPLEKDDARAAIALELYRLDRGSALARQTADEMRQEKQEQGVVGRPYPQTLFVEVLKEEKWGPNAPRGTLPDSDRAVVGIALLRGNADEAVKLARRHTTPASQLRSLTWCAEWAEPPAAALEEARAVIESSKGNRNVVFSPYHLLRLAQIAGQAGSADQAKFFASAIADDGLRVWAVGDSARLRWIANPREVAEESALDMPEDAKNLRVGHFWGLYWLARRNAAVSGDRTGGIKAIANWPDAARPFGLAGIALGRQDR